MLKDEQNIAERHEGVNKAGYTKVPNSLFADQRFRGLRPSSQMVLIVLLRHYNQRKRIAWPTQETIANAIGLGKRSVWTAIADLRATGLIEATRRRINGSTRLVYSFPFIDQVEADCESLGSVSGSRLRRSIAMSDDQVEAGCVGESKQAANRTEEQQTKEQTTTTPDGEEVVVVGHVDPRQKMMTDAGVSDRDAKLYAGRWDAEYLTRLIAYCADKATDNPIAYLVKALRDPGEWPLPKSKTSERPSEEVEKAYRDALWNRILQAWSVASPDQLAVLEDRWSSAEGLFYDCPFTFEELAGASADALSKLVQWCDEHPRVAGAVA